MGLTRVCECMWLYGVGEYVVAWGRCEHARYLCESNTVSAWGWCVYRGGECMGLYGVCVCVRECMGSVSAWSRWVHGVGASMRDTFASPMLCPTLTPTNRKILIIAVEIIPDLVELAIRNFQLALHMR